MTSAPLALSYRWQTPVVITTLAMIGCLGVLVRNQPAGWVSAAVLVVLCWTVFALVIWRRTRAQLLVDGSALSVRTFRRWHRVEGADVREVKELMTPSGASYRLRVETETGVRHQLIPTALLRRGHSTLFGWILTWAPQARLDRGSQRSLEDLQDRGLVDRNAP